MMLFRSCFARSTFYLSRANNLPHAFTPPFKTHLSNLALIKLQLLGQATDMKAQKDRVKTRFLIISDTHSASPNQNAGENDIAFRPPLHKADVLLHCGDLTMVGLLHEYEKTLDMLESIDADLKLVIAGNHDISLASEHECGKNVRCAND
jgi:predicted MPP superfamily phosphohydrolase